MLPMVRALHRPAADIQRSGQVEWRVGPIGFMHADDLHRCLDGFAVIL